MENQLTILILPGATISNINSCIKIGEILRNRGHRIVFSANNAYDDKLIKYGFENIESKLELFSNTNTIESLNKRLANNFINSGFFDISLSPLVKIQKGQSLGLQFISQCKDADEKIKKIIDSVKPNVIIIDIFRTVSPSLIKCERPWIKYNGGNPLRNIINEKLPPPLLGLSSIDSSEWSKYREEFCGSIKPLNKEINKWFFEEKISPLPENCIICESPFLNIYKFPKELDYSELITMPENFFQIDSLLIMDDEKFVIPENFIDKLRKIILIGMGTMVSANVIMMKRMINILAKTPYYYIVSKGPCGDEYELPSNMFGDSLIPQTQVMPLVNMVITHGGNGTVTEAFYFGLPMIVMPICNDQYDNAQRIADKGYGIRMDPQTYTETELIDAIEKILNDESLQKRMKEASKRIQSQYNEKCDKLGDLIELFAK